MNNAANSNAAVDASLPFAIGRGETWENAVVRIHRFAESFHVTELVGAGKRGKRCRVASYSPNMTRVGVERWMDRMASVLPDYGDFDAIRRLISDLLVDFPGEINVFQREARGVDVDPPCQKIHLTTESIEVVATATDALVSDRRDLCNESRAMPRGKTAAKRFYAWLTANDVAVRGMTFCGLVTAARGAGVELHQWCGMD